MENLGEDSYKPGVVGALTALYLGSGEEETALKVFEKTVEFYEKNKVCLEDNMSLLFISLIVSAKRCQTI